MMPAIDPRYDARRKRARVAVFITAGAIVASSALGGTRFGGWRWLPWALGITLIIVFCAVSMNSGGSPRGRRGMSGMSGLGGRDLALGSRLDGLAAHRRHGLVMVSRMMPGPAGRRWLAETESVLWEITAARRGAAVRSYLVSGPRVATVMWAHACLRRVRPGPRDPG
jgi:hypothetical protein